MIHRIVKSKKISGTGITVRNSGKALVKAIPKTVELRQMRPSVRRFTILSIELLVGFLVLGAFVLGLLYYRLEQGNIALSFVVPSIEKAINEQLTDLSVKIESAYLGKNANSAGVHFRLRNIAMYNKKGDVIANAPLAAVDLNGKALMWGRVAPSEVVFIKPTLDISHNAGGGFSLTYSDTSNTSDPIAGLLKSNSKIEPAPTPQAPARSSLEKIDIMSAVTAAFEEARAHNNTSSFLTQFGVRDATVNFKDGNTTLSWKVPDFIIDLKHGEKKSLIRGFGKVSLGAADNKAKPWKVRFQTQQSDHNKRLRVDIGFKDITTGSLQHLVPQIKKIGDFDIPLSGKLNAELNNSGEIQSAFANLKLSSGNLILPWSLKEKGGKQVPFELGNLKLAYSSKSNRILIVPSPIRWGGNQTNLSGFIEPVYENDTVQRWRFMLRAEETRLGAYDLNLKPMIVDEWWVQGSFSPEDELLKIENYYLKAGNAEIKMHGRVENALSKPAVFMEGGLSSLSVPVLKRLWPQIVASNARQWVGERILEGQLVSGAFKIALPSSVLEQFSSETEIEPEMLQVEIKLADINVRYIPELPPLHANNATVKIIGRQFSVDIPRATVKAGNGNYLKLSHGSFSIPDLRMDIPTADMDFRIAGRATELIHFINQPGFKFVDADGLKPGMVSGDVKGIMGLHFPLENELKFEDVSANGSLRMTNITSKGLLGPEGGVTGGTASIKINERSIGVDGGVIIKDVPANVTWQRILGSKGAKQPPLRLSTVLNKTSLDKLGFSHLNQFIKGDIPVVVTLTTRKGREDIIQARADLTGTQITHNAIGWKKAPGQPAVLQFNISPQENDMIELQNFNLVANDFVLEGNVKLNGKSGQLAAFRFPRFSYQLFNSMELSGSRTEQGTLSLVANVKSMDGRKALQRLFFNKGPSPRKGSRKRKTARANNKTKTRDQDKESYDLTAYVETIIGGHGAYISDTKLNVKKRDGKIEWLDLKGLLYRKSGFAIRIERERNGRRYLKAESNDAGGTLRMLGLFPNISNGELSLKVDMDQRGRAEKKGTLWAKDFSLITKQKVGERVSTQDVFGVDMTDTSQMSGRKRKGQIVHTKLHFKRLKAPFSYGNGQFVLHDSYVNGPVLGATLRGKIDFRTERMRLGGTYVPLYGLNSAISEIPLLNELLVGRKGEGVFGVTFGIEGRTSNPTVIVNPVSLLTPGVFRQIFDFNTSIKNQKIKNDPFNQTN